MKTTALSLVVLALCSGCSWIFVVEAPEPEISGELGELGAPAFCSSSRVWPIFDVVLSVLELGGVVGYATDTEAGASPAGPILGAVLFAIIHGASAAYGFGEVTRCEGYLEGFDYDQ